MLINQFGQTYYAGEGIDLHPGNQFAITDSVLALIVNAIQESQRNAPNGFAGLDEQSLVYAAVRVLSVTSAVADGLVPREGELLVTSDTKELRYGDSLKIGGFRAGLNSKSMIYCGGDSTPAENGLSVSNAYGVAKNANPNGMAKSATNKMYVVLGNGVHDVNAAVVGGMQFDTPFIELVGLDMHGCRINLTSANIASTNHNFGFRNLTFYKNGTGHGIVFRFTDVPVVMNWENLRFEGIATDTVIQSLSREGGAVVSSWSGTVKNVKTLCTQLLCASSGLPSHTINLIFDDCEAGAKYISGIGGSRPTFAGTMRNCVWNNTTTTAYELASTARLYNTYFGRELNFCNTGARIEYCRFKPAAGVYSLKGTSAIQDVFVAHCILSAYGIDAITLNNTAGATPYNVLSDVTY